MLSVNENFDQFLLNCKHFCVPCDEGTCMRLVVPVPARATDVGAILDRLKTIDADIDDLKLKAKAASYFVGLHAPLGGSPSV